MPSPTQINESLATIANDALPLAVAWHVAFLLAGIALFRGWRPTRRVAGTLLTLPLFSVGLLAWRSANPFNAAVFLLLALRLLWVARRMGEPRVLEGPPGATGLGGLMVVLGWTYPHFLDGGSPLRYLYAAPTGLVPCPTLAIVIGLTLIGDGLGSAGWAVTLGFAGAFYALFGAFRLGVAIDLLLAVGAAALIIRASRRLVTA